MLSYNKKNASILAVFMSTLLLCSLINMFSSYASEGWIQDANGKRYQKSDGHPATDCWCLIEHEDSGSSYLYRFDEKGYLYCNTTTPDGYLVDSNGILTTDNHPYEIIHDATSTFTDKLPKDFVGHWVCYGSDTGNQKSIGPFEMEVSPFENGTNPERITLWSLQNGTREKICESPVTFSNTKTSFKSPFLYYNYQGDYTIETFRFISEQTIISKTTAADEPVDRKSFLYYRRVKQGT